MSMFGQGRLWVLIGVAFFIAIPYCGVWPILGAAALAYTIGSVAMTGANQTYYPDGTRRPHHPTKNPHGPRRK